MIEAKNLTRSVGTGKMLDDVHFKINNGKIYGILGTDDAAKTTLLRLLSGVLPPTSGCVKINCLDLQKDALRAKRCIGYMPSPPALCHELTPYETLRFIAKARGLSELRAAKSINRALELTGTDRIRDRLIDKLTEAERRRVGIAAALIGNPEILLLEAPTAGLPRRDAKEIGELILSVGKSNTVLFTPQSVAEARTLCAHVLVLHGGKLIINAPIEEIKDLDSIIPTLLALPTQPKPEHDGEYEPIDTKEGEQ